jgi:transaldolase
MDRPVDPAIVDQLYDRFVEFRRAYDEDGMTADEFEDFGASARTLRTFLAGYHTFVQVIRDVMLPNPDVT